MFGRQFYFKRNEKDETNLNVIKHSSLHIHVIDIMYYKHRTEDVIKRLYNVR
jgi:hypothetical protein